MYWKQRRSLAQSLSSMQAGYIEVFLRVGVGVVVDKEEEREEVGRR